MNNIKIDMALQLMNMLHEANLADVVNSDYEERENDLSWIHASQTNLYGNLSDAIKNLGFEQALENYLMTGDRPTKEALEESIAPVPASILTLEARLIELIHILRAFDELERQTLSQDQQQKFYDEYDDKLWTYSQYCESHSLFENKVNY